MGDPPWGSLSVVLVNHASQEFTVRAVRAVLASEGIDSYRVHIVDNTGDRSCLDALATGLGQPTDQLGPDTYRWSAALPAECREVLLSIVDNNGFGAGCNVGLRTADRDGYRRTLFLNPDTIVAPEALRAMEATADESAAAFTGAVLVEAAKPSVVQMYGGGTYTSLTSSTKITGAGLELADLASRRLDAPTLITGACVLVDTADAMHAGGFDEHQFLYYEEAALVARYHAAGLPTTTAVAKTAIVQHHGGSTTQAHIHRRSVSALNQYHAARSAILYAWTYDRRYRFVVALSRFLYALTMGPAGARRSLTGLRDGLRAARINGR